jgi:DNA-binding transcriptional regulator YiaG
MYHYIDSGLSNVFLKSGYRMIDTPYGRGVGIENLDALHLAIGKWLLTVPKQLNGAEFRFLRHELDMSQARLARLLGEKEQNIGRWERARDRPVNPSADRIIRALYSEFIGGNTTIRQLIEALAERDERQAAELRFSPTKRGWTLTERKLAA